MHQPDLISSNRHSASATRCGKLVMPSCISSLVTPLRVQVHVIAKTCATYSQSSSSAN